MCNILLSPICGIDDAAGGVASAVGGSFIDSVSDSAGKAAPAHAAENGIGLHAFGKLALDLVHHARMSLPQERIVVRRYHDPVRYRYHW